MSRIILIDETLSIPRKTSKKLLKQLMPEGTRLREHVTNVLNSYKEILTERPFAFRIIYQDTPYVDEQLTSAAPYVDKWDEKIVQTMSDIFGNEKVGKQYIESSQGATQEFVDKLDNLSNRRWERDIAYGEWLLSCIDDRLELIQSVYERLDYVRESKTNTLFHKLFGVDKTDTKSATQIMGDVYNIHGQAASVGPNTTVSNVNFSQIWLEYPNDLDVNQLISELEILRQEMKKNSVSESDDISTGEIASATVSAKKGDLSSLGEHLKSAGKFALDTASKIGVPLAVEVLKKALGLP